MSRIEELEKRVEHLETEVELLKELVNLQGKSRNDRYNSSLPDVPTPFWDTSFFSHRCDYCWKKIKRKTQHIVILGDGDWGDARYCNPHCMQMAHEGIPRERKERKRSDSLSHGSEMSKWELVSDRQVYLEYCPKCGKENHAFFVAKGKCCWCGYEANQEGVKDYENQSR